MSDSERLDEVIALLSEVRNWLRIGFFREARTTLHSVLNTEKKQRAYQLADGTMSADAIRKSVSMSPNAVIELFNTCTDLGLMEMLPDKKRRRLFDLRNFGFEGDQTEI